MHIIKIPKAWELSDHQTLVMEYLLEFAGQFVSASELMDEVYGEELDEGAFAPSKLRVLIQRCRETLLKHTDDAVRITVVRGKGWRFTKKHATRLRAIIDEVNGDV